MEYRQTRSFHLAHRGPLPDFRHGTISRQRETLAASFLWSVTLHGEPVPRHATRTIAVVRGVPQLVRSTDARSWQNAALSQLLNRRPSRPLARELRLDCHVW